MLVTAGTDPDKVADGWRLVEERAAELPVADTFASRRSTVGLLAEFTARTGARGLGAITSIQEDLDDLTERLDVYVAHLPKQGRWQAELLLLEVLGDTGTLAGGIREAAPIPIQLDAVPPWVEELPDEIAAIVDAEHRRLETWIRAERLDTLRFVTAEREAVLAAVAAERALVLDVVASEREAVFEAVSAERAAALDGIRAIARDTLVEARSEVIDHAVFRLAQLLGGFGVLAFLAALVLVRVARGSGPARSA
jgi:hypothetical protein